ncbi:MAG: adenosylcobinamide-GDP ribazoletransferase [Bacteroidales bacterium]|nr:adenosylcobinamide-GDP ribazoletransferase [Lachnoclostridium sp.]MCM1384251.1 adenosylcobinamide-GDP ribazoletransferase [Lachnoclostridium sp.]MCM1464750.1 adenosylcobinamide-GDP ribazoletransferase [Bacteroidales bacterium]
MGILKSIIIAFSLYSQIPVPQFAWKDEDMKYVLCFFPWVGAIIGVGIYLWGTVCDRLDIGILCYAAGGALLPLLITGGFHVDGFMDTMDAFHSCRPRERKLEILKDSHVGAFAVIMLGAYALFYLGAFSEIREKAVLKIVCAGFVLSRCLSAIGVVSFPTAKNEGLLVNFAKSAKKNTVKFFLYLQGALCVGFMVGQSFPAGGVVSAAAIGAFVYYYYRCKKELGGITGDTAGYFVLLCEGSMLGAAAVWQILK